MDWIVKCLRCRRPCGLLCQKEGDRLQKPLPFPGACQGTQREGAWAERGGPRLLAWLGVSGRSNCRVLIEFGGPQYCKAWDLPARGCVALAAGLIQPNFGLEVTPRQLHAAGTLRRASAGMNRVPPLEK